jgi:hypothetical protein
MKRWDMEMEYKKKVYCNNGCAAKDVNGYLKFENPIRICINGFAYGSKKYPIVC